MIWKLCALLFNIATAIILTPAFGQTLREQKECADQARDVFRELSKQDSVDAKKVGMRIISSDYESHFNTKLNRCFIFTTTISDIGGGIFLTSKDLSNAFEKRTYATYGWKSDKVKKYWQVPPFDCELTPSRGETEFCKSQEEFDNFVKKYMEE